MSIDMGNLASILYRRYEKALELDLSSIASCEIKEHVFELCTHSGLIVSYPLRHIEFVTKEI